MSLLKVERCYGLLHDLPFETPWSQGRRMDACKIVAVRSPRFQLVCQKHYVRQVDLRVCFKLAAVCALYSNRKNIMESVGLSLLHSSLEYPFVCPYIRLHNLCVAHCSVYISGLEWILTVLTYASCQNLSLTVKIMLCDNVVAVLRTASLCVLVLDVNLAVLISQLCL